MAMAQERCTNMDLYIFFYTSFLFIQQSFLGSNIMGSLRPFSQVKIEGLGFIGID